MTKLMLCGECGDVVAPGLQNHDVRWCACGRHAVWWENSRTGQLRLHDKWMPERSGGDGGKAWVIGLHNGVLMEGGLIANMSYPTEQVGDVTYHGNLLTRKEQVERLLEDTPSTYLFKRAHSLVVRIAPGSSNDTAWSMLPMLIPMAFFANSYTTQPAESVAGIAARELGDWKRWTEIRDLNADRFPNMLGPDYYPVGTVLKMPPK